MPATGPGGAGSTAVYVDGRVSAVHDVSIGLRDGVLTVDGGAVARREPLAAVSIDPPLGSAPRWIRFRDGAACEVSGHAALGWLARVDPPPAGLPAALDARPWRQALSVVLIAVAAALTYLASAPRLAARAAEALPDAAVETIGRRALVSLDAGTLRPSALARERQADILRAFWTVRWPDPNDGRAAVLLFRQMDGRPDALALPDGTLIISDALVEEARGDAELLGVLAHGMGHVAGRHAIRELLRDAPATLAFTWVFGSAAGLPASTPTRLLALRYPDDLERAADRYGVRALLASGVSPAAYADLLERLDAGGHLRTGAAGRAGGSRDAGAESYVDRHPVTPDRIRGLREAAAGSNR